jgi:hypothetical protein
MDREQIIQWAREAAKSHPDYKEGRDSELPDEMVVFLGAFAKKVRDDYSNKHAQLWLKRIDEAVIAEREACAEVADYMAGRCKHPDEIADAICARGNK